jgi:signal transduction histidine kinase
VLSRRATKSLGRMVDQKTEELARSSERLERTLAELQAVHAFQQSVIDGVAEPLLVIGTDYRIRLMNLAARRASLDGGTLPDPCRCHEVSHQRSEPCQGAAHPCPLEKVQNSGEPMTVVHEHYTADGERRVVEVLASPLFGDEGTVEGIIESMRDITERVRAEEALEGAYALQQSLVEEERQRIARELHDGLAQLLGYVNTKAMAVRLLLQKGQIDSAERHLSQLEEAARELFVDVRQAILDLKMSGQEGGGLVDTLEAFVAQYTRLSGVPVELVISPRARELELAADVELQMLRIAQEALANVRKHAQATRVRVTVGCDGSQLELTVSDDGRGFTPEVIAPAEWPHIGLSTMRERAQSIGATFRLDTEPGRGTRISVRVALGCRRAVHAGVEED